MKIFVGVYENVKFVGPIYKDRILKEYINRVRKIRSSKLSNHNKVTSYNSFVVPFITLSVAVLNWTKNDDIKQIELQTRKILNMIGNLYPNNDIDRLYCNKKSGGRGLRSSKIMFESRLVVQCQHLTQ